MRPVSHTVDDPELPVEAPEPDALVPDAVTPDAAAEPAEVPEPVPLLAPADGLPEVVHTSDQLRTVATRLADGHGPVAVDAERASGFRYSARAYLVQLRRSGVGSVLIDPIPLGPGRFAPLAQALDGPEWVLHAASQDLACLAELGLRPARLFDTELAGRLAGLPRVGLGPMVEQLLGLRLEKGHGAADWSTRPPETSSRSSSSCGMSWTTCSPRKASGSGPRRSSRRCAPRRPRHRRPTRGGAPRASTGSAGHDSWPPSARCGRPATSWPMRTTPPA